MKDVYKRQALRHLDGRRQFVSNRIDRIRDSLGSGTEITVTPALVDLIGVDHRFMPVDFVYIIGIDLSLIHIYVVTPCRSM